jgi:hypothetical protein
VKRIAVALVLAWSCVANADVPAGVASRVARFIFAGCDYFDTKPPQPDNPGPLDKKLAAHFGRVTRSELDGIRVRYDLKVSGFDGWDVSYWSRGIDIKFPPTVTITMGDLQKILGPDDAIDVDYALSTTSTGAKIATEEREFNPKREDNCYVTVRAEADKRKGPERRVFSLRFSN